MAVPSASAAWDVRHLCPGWRTSQAGIGSVSPEDGAHPRRGEKCCPTEAGFGCHIEGWHVLGGYEVDAE